MCGIAGYWSEKINLEEKEFRRALTLIQHRGPDKSQIIKLKNGFLGTNRLQIIGNPMEGQQPIQKDQLAMAFNGAIYNYPELGKSINFQSNSDTEILFNLYQKKEIQAFNDLQGMFAVAFVHESKNQITLARDRIGQKPLYYYKDHEVFIFASEIKSIKYILQALQKQVEISEKAVFHYLCFSNIPEPETIYKNIYALQPGHFLTWENDNFQINNYWSYQYQPKSSLDLEEAKKQCKSLIEQATKIRLRADVPIGLFLSGGWDSSIIAYEAIKYQPNLTAYTVDYPFHTSQNELAIASATAQQLGMQHHCIRVEDNPADTLIDCINYLDQPLGDNSLIPNLSIAKAASKEVKVMLTGDGGDEQFGGYRRYFLAKNAQKLNFLKYLKSAWPNGNRRSLVGFIKRMGRIMDVPQPLRYLLYTTDMWQDNDIKDCWNGNNPKGLETYSILSQYEDLKLSELDQLMHFDRNFNLPSGILSKLDRSSMMYSIEARSPLLDHQLFEFTSSLPDDLKINFLDRKYLLKSIYKDKLPKSITQAPKTSFEAPISQWLSHDLNPMIHELLHNPQAKIYQYLHYADTMLLLKGGKYNERNVDYMIYCLLILELWLIKHE